MFCDKFNCSDVEMVDGNIIGVYFIYILVAENETCEMAQGSSLGAIVVLIF